MAGLPIPSRNLLACVWLLGVWEAGAWPRPQPLSPQGGPWRSVGNHRYEIQVPASAELSAAYVVDLRWRRPDPDPAAKGTVLLDAVTEMPVPRCRRLSATADFGRFAFAGVPGGIYHLYYMPFETCEFDGGSCRFGQVDGLEDMVHYSAFAGSCNDTVWWEVGNAGIAVAGPRESRTAFDAFGPLEQAASMGEAQELLTRAGGVVLVAQPREAAVRMLEHLPHAWTGCSVEALASLRGAAQPGEAYSFQVAVAADRPLLVDAAEMMTPLAQASGALIPRDALRCLNLRGVDYWGRPFTSRVEVQAGKVAVLWFVLDIPSKAVWGNYSGRLMVNTSRGGKAVALTLEIRGPVLADHGFSDMWRGARLAWLDSTLGNEDDVPPPFVPVSVSNRTVKLLDKIVEISKGGLLASVRIGGVETLASPMRLEVLVGGTPVPIPMRLALGPPQKLALAWKAWGAVGGTSVNVSASLDATGFADFTLEVETHVAHELRVIVPSKLDNAIYAAGLGRPGGFLRRWFNGSAAPLLWHWDGVNGNNAVWVGSTRSGLRFRPRGGDPLWQAGVPFDSDKAPDAPLSWSNHGAGGMAVWPNGTIVAFTGLRPASRLAFHFAVLATPTRPLDLPKHFAERYAQVSGPVNFTHLHAGGASVVNIHQGNVLNPWINYPYLTNSFLKQAADACHALGMKLKVYNTVRELSNHALELWALRALNETFVWREDLGGGGDWLREHLGRGYSVAWATPLPPHQFWSDQLDMAIKVKAMSRWNNYYVEGLRQIRKDYACDGIYLDEIAYDRVTMRRARAVLGSTGLIDHHSDRGGFTKCPVVNYMEMLPFIDSLWYGEGFDYDGASPDHWLVEMSGLPFGLTSDLLRYSGMTPFHFRGMLFASANRWQDNLGMRPGSSDAFDPRSVWSLWESFGIANSTMHGWWLAEEGGRLPVVPNSSEVKCTTFVRPAYGALVVLANFGAAQAVTLSYDWGLLGLEAQDLWLRAPVLSPMQPRERTWLLGAAIDVPAPVRGSETSREGWLLLLERRPASRFSGSSGSSDAGDPSVAPDASDASDASGEVVGSLLFTT